MKHLYNIILLFKCTFDVVAIMCPSKVNEIDSYNVKKKFQAMREDLGGKVLKARGVHKYEKPEIYDYEIRLCGDNGSAAITQIDVNEKKKIVGRHVENSALIGADNWIFIQYMDGDPYHKQKHCNGQKRQGWLSIRCEDQGETPTLRFIEEGRWKEGEKHKETICYYLFEYNHKYACSDEILKKLENKRKLSGGAIFCIVLLSFTLAYFLFGFIYQRFVAGAKGLEQIPNFSFWKKVGNASADGCDFVCRREEHPTTYKGMADALDIDSSEDEKDDGLLPM